MGNPLKIYTIWLVITVVNTIASYPIMKNPGNNITLDMLFKQQGHLWDRSATLQTDCIASQIALADFDTYDVKELSHLCDDPMSYDEFKINTVIRFVKKYYALFADEKWHNKAMRMEGYSLAGAMLDIYDLYIEQHKTPDEAYRALASLMFPLFTDLIDITEWAHKALTVYDKIRYRLIESVMNNYSEYHITAHKRDAVVYELNKYNFTSIRKLLKDLVPGFYSNKRCLFDGKRIGLGSVVFSLLVNKHDSYTRNLQGWRDGLLDFTFNDSMIYYITNYDMTVVSHGDDMVVRNNDWNIHPVKTPYDVTTYHSVNKLILSLYNATRDCRDINVLVCNPTKSKVYPEIYKLKDLHVTIYEGNVIIG